MTLLIKDRRTGAEIMLQPALGPNMGDLHKVAVGNDVAKRVRQRREALWDGRVPNDLRNRILDFRKRAEQMPDGFSGGPRFHKDRSDLATDVVSREDLPGKVQRRLLALVLDAAAISPVSAGTAHKGAGPYDRPFTRKGLW